MENWKPISSHPDYEVSDQGRVRRVVVADIWHPAHDLTGWLHSTGCVCVTIFNDGKRKAARVHRLVAQAFLPNPQNLPTVNHKDGDKTNNAVENLEWATSRRQIIHAIQTGLHEVKGYGFHKAAKKWAARIEAEGIKYHLGLFATELEAAMARKAAENIYHNLEEIA